MSNNHRNTVSEDTQPTDAKPIEEPRPDPEQAAEPVSVNNSFNTNPERQQTWLSYLRDNDRADEADALEAELAAGKTTVV